MVSEWHLEAGQEGGVRVLVQGDATPRPGYRLTD